MGGLQAGLDDESRPSSLGIVGACEVFHRRRHLFGILGEGLGVLLLWYPPMPHC